MRNFYLNKLVEVKKEEQKRMEKAQKGKNSPSFSKPNFPK
jgi:hypothetical protein